MGTTERTWTHEVDVVVVGSGNGGMSAAIAAARAGARTMVVEIDKVTGGSSAMSGGGIRIGGANSYDEYLAVTHGMHDPAFSRVYFESYLRYIDWLRTIGAAIRPSPDGGIDIWMGTDRDGASEPQCRAYFDSLERIFADAGGLLLLRARARRILTGDDGAIVGLRAKRWTSSPFDDTGETVTIKARNVILAAGGFQNNKELCARYIGPEADLISAVGSPFHRGEGMILAQEIGASLSGSMSGIYGSHMSAFPAKRPMEDVRQWLEFGEADRTRLFNLLWFNTPPGFIAVNLNGKRFIDEVEIRYRVSQAVARQPRATGIMLFDQAMYDEVADLRMLSPGTGATEAEKFEARTALEGPTLLKADTIEELADKLAEPGPNSTYRPNLMRTIAECHRAADARNPDLDIRRSELRKLEKGPFYAWPFTAGVVYTMGGLAINTSAQVLDQQKLPIPGLYASPPCAGGVFRDYYGGSIASAGTFGWIAGQHAAARSA
ncbi:FAD-binding protein [Rhizorhabdus dicambivorans]|uniref:FAD-binding protein n=1 Tax=Rhizorhabdus dicambivorans TaxID=1850238 RepID=A0A2A4FXM5_9SPHN|nr:FAD-binding protein [Rhizorhabdus dicambivorans]ATE65849.1 FAD-binding protein [Rhizorhabdus dicambivorans]PCE42963.1 FAD-binding protein [Rhizorhabdus dicambivorans]